MNTEQAVFRALADPTRRTILDALFESDGQTVGQLVALFPDVTRFAVMKHLTVLEEADLVATEKVGREKRHHLNPVPIAQIADRWVSKYAQPFTRTLLDLQSAAENPSNHPRPKDAT
ncbi:transcriptional regulator [Janibacter sp. HTCC2649]|uniref:ArsR/SmtB family transcription factor n=1 Tax=Janibacter sp. HTCC2649 TaxID=313589 RepID=UPI000066E9C3|nr:metalloregulator ArsR/SmtB family transcription factor [Janibacter sp. HTCC2649]EAP99619.1 transcriptional regulator [Janibacter sp. HTCC2649]